MPDDATAKRKKLRALLAREEVLFMPGGFSPVYARAAELAGFESPPGLPEGAELFVKDRCMFSRWTRYHSARRASSLASSRWEQRTCRRAERRAWIPRSRCEVNRWSAIVLLEGDTHPRVG